MPFVLDASVSSAWLLPDEGHPQADAALDRLEENEAVAPAVWWFEARNVLIVSERRGRLDPGLAASALGLLAKLPVRIDRDPDEASILALARRHRLTVYDAAYLELALRGGAQLATLDDALAAAARGEGVELV